MGEEKNNKPARIRPEPLVFDSAYLSRVAPNGSWRHGAENEADIFDCSDVSGNAVTERQLYLSVAEDVPSVEFICHTLYLYLYAR